MKKCPQCNQTYPNLRRLCPADGAVLSLDDPYELSGKTLGGKYQLEALVGLGGGGAVYCARQLNLQRRVAVKILLPNLAIEDPQNKDDFEREAQLVAQLTHENIVAIYDFGRTDKDIPYLVMEWLEGRLLNEALAERGRLDFAEAAGLLRQIGAALAAAHARGIVHRDLKPGNVILVARDDGGERVKVLDFGIAKVLHSAASRVSRVVGTPRYASPEQLKLDAEIDHRADLFALGVLLYQMLTSEMPFAGKTEGQYIAQLLTAQPEPLRQRRPDAPVEMERLVMQLLAQNPAHRPPNVAEVLRRFESALPSAPQINAPPASTSGKLAGLGRWVSEALTGVRPKPSAPLNPPARPTERNRIVIDLSPSPPLPPPPPSLPTFEFLTVTVNERGKIVQRRNGEARCLVADLNGVELEMVALPGGEFQMGSTDAEAQTAFAEAKRYWGDKAKEWWYTAETPRHRVVVSPFFIGKYQVTQAQWRAVAKLPKKKSELDLPPDPSRFKGDNLPVENVSWEEADEFCQRVSRLTGEHYRLPTEAEWEYACRAGTTTPFAFGPNITPEIVNYAGSHPYGNAPKGEYRQTTVPGGSLGVANAWGLYDLHGNVWEWCEDHWHSNYKGAPTDGTAWTDISSAGSGRVNRGGGWLNYAVHCRSAFRNHDAPGLRIASLGFRLVRT